ncbi:MAG TPA: ABC transporter substrate-binding protein [Candidatus Acidoferrales bacterium]|nr:ABC transporter substrate-binding protein [Candidatus Acidoferrales bacterium]
MRTTISRLFVGAGLIGLIAAVLLLSDWHQRKAKAKANAASSLAKKWKVHIIEYVATVDTEEGERGVLTGLRDAGLVEGRDYDVHVRNAQGDMPAVSALVDTAVTEGADLLITITTPALQAALRRGKGTPIVFSVVSDAIAAGAGRSDNDHLPNVTGVHYQGAYPEMLRLMRENFPSVRVLGTLFAPAEINMVREKDRLLEAARQTGIEIVALAVNSSGEMGDAALSLVNRRIDAICNLPGNLTSAGFPTLVAAARDRQIPIFTFHSAQARQGAIVALARDYFDSGREAGLLAARVMRGENPGKIPFQAHSKNKLMVNLEAARNIGLTVPSTLIEKAEVIGK